MTADHSPLPRRLTESVEAADRLDAPVRALRALADTVLDDHRVRDLLRGAPLGHAAHPLLTDLPIGLWVSSTALDLLAPRSGRRAADRLLGLGVLAAAPTAATGLADWASSGERVQRVGVVHAALNTVCLAMYGGSWLLRRRGHRAAGVALSLGAGGVLGVSGYLGGHMAFVQHAPQQGD